VLGPELGPDSSMLTVAHTRLHGNADCTLASPIHARLVQRRCAPLNWRAVVVNARHDDPAAGARRSDGWRVIQGFSLGTNLLTQVYVLTWVGQAHVVTEVYAAIGQAVAAGELGTGKGPRQRAAQVADPAHVRRQAAGLLIAEELPSAAYCNPLAGSEVVHVTSRKGPVMLSTPFGG